MARRNPTLGVLVFYAVLVTAALLLVLARGPEPRGVTAGEAKQEARRLATLVRYTRVEVPDGEGPLQVTWSPAPGGYRALAILPPGRHGAEVHLAARLTVDDPALLRSPARQALPSATLVREPPASDLARPGAGLRLRLIVDPGAGGDAGAVVSVDNLLGASGSAAATSVARAWKELGRAPEPALDSRDLRVLAVLTRVLRAKVCDDPAAGSGCRASALTLRRNPRAGSYAVTLTALSGAAGELPFELEVRSVGRRLRSGELQPLPGATLTLPAELRVLPPRDGRGGGDPGEPDPAVARYRPGDPAWAAESWTIDFGTLLDGTAW